MSMKSYAPGKDLGEKPWLTLTDFHLYCQWQSVVEFRPQSFLPDRYLGEIKHLASITAHLTPRPHESVFKRKRSRFAPDTAIVHTTSPKTEPFENALQLSGAIWKHTFWKRCFLVWTEKTMLSENGDVIKIDTTGRQTTRPWVSKMADRRCHVASISRQFRGPIYWNAHESISFEHAHWGYKSVFKMDWAL